MSLLEVRRIECRYRGRAAVRGLSFAVENGELCCLLGPSGGGKTTVLRAIAGLEPLAAGQISLDGRVLSTPRRQTPPERRGVGLVFQQYALFPHLSARDNIGFGLHRESARQRRRRVDAALATVDLDAREALRYPQELSGGQQQRVALARALVLEPQLLLLDEPFSNLDATLRRQLNLELKALLKKKKISALLVTHDQEEAFGFADSMGLLHDGQLQQWDTPYNLYHRPQSRFVARFVGHGCFIPGQLLDNRLVRTALGDFPHSSDQGGPALAPGPVDVLLRPDDVLYDRDSAIRCTVLEKLFAGDRILYTLRIARGEIIQALLPSHLDFELAQEIGVSTDLEHLILFPSQGAIAAPGAAPGERQTSAAP